MGRVRRRGKGNERVVWRKVWESSLISKAGAAAFLGKVPSHQIGLVFSTLEKKLIQASERKYARNFLGALKELSLSIFVDLCIFHLSLT